MPGDAQPSQDLRLPSGGFDDLPGLQREDGLVLRGAGARPVAGPGDDAGGDGYDSILLRAAKLRFPSLKEFERQNDRVDALIDYIAETAIVRGDLEELRLETEAELLDFRARWRKLPIPSNLSAPQAEAARRKANPELAETLDRARWLVERCSEGIARFGGSDYDAASRCYTLIAGS